MARPDVHEGFRLWRDEVEALERPEKEVVYIPIIALTGIYTVCTQKEELLNSYHWRRTVLESADALTGLRTSLSSIHRDSVDDTFELPIEHVKPDEGAALQFVASYASLMDGLPEGVNSVAYNEWFLAQNLGYAEHDYGVTFYPLRLSVGGIEAIKNNYPLTSQFVSEAI
jgi:hypothetical protein